LPYVIRHEVDHYCGVFSNLANSNYNDKLNNENSSFLGYPARNAAHIALQTVRTFIKENPGKMTRIIFCVFLNEDLKVYEELMQLYFPMQ